MQRPTNLMPTLLKCHIFESTVSCKTCNRFFFIPVIMVALLSEGQSNVIQMHGNIETETFQVATEDKHVSSSALNTVWMLLSLKGFSYHNSSLLCGMLGEDINNEKKGRYFMILDFPKSGSMAMTRWSALVYHQYANQKKLPDQLSCEQ